MKAFCKAGVFVVVVTLGISPAFAAQEMAEALAGTWEGAWYRGMTSGQLTLEIRPDGSGSIEFTNLEMFGEEAAPFSRSRFTDSGFEFSAGRGAGGAFVGRIRHASGAERLRGEARYDGFPVTFEIRRADP
jgi:hypothetical protein